ncbi:AI-2E family transporter [Candidatus Aminicenantes bacterium AC-335-B20]|nr:AI-2E family transporter [SCandidatus Aminicenantes bacterium Aminicenantia_JdfR_composite]MCP2599176.1 AI-2E family transporter [Candidatus Aminicenantes bacterium AC-335-B20]MCP2620752.1 AI-2E family transporter [Candidatus Aminicenantes bacterium AC-334-E05]
MKESRVIAFFLGIISLFIIGVFLKYSKPVLVPFSLAVFLSFLLNPVVEFLTRKKIPKAIAIIFILIFTFILLYLLGLLLYSSGKAFASDLPRYGKKFDVLITNLSQKWKLTSGRLESIDWAKQLNFSSIASFLLSSLGSFLKFLTNLFLVLLFLVFILAGRGRLRDKILKSFKGQNSKKIIEIISNVDRQVYRYLSIKTFISLITGILAGLVLYIFGVNYAVLWGFLTFLLNYIPNLGSVIATVFPVLMAIIQFEKIWTALWILLILIVIQTLMGNVIEPRVLGIRLGLSPLVVILSLIFWGWLWGIVGMILAVPITSTIKIICENIPELRVVSELLSQ